MDKQRRDGMVNGDEEVVVDIIPTLYVFTRLLDGRIDGPRLSSAKEKMISVNVHHKSSHAAAVREVNQP